MPVKLISIGTEIVPDPDADTSYLEQDEFVEELAAYHAGEFDFVGVRAVAVIEIPMGDHSVRETITSPGLWGIESRSGDDYLAEVGRDELDVLGEMLRELRVQR